MQIEVELKDMQRLAVHTQEATGRFIIHITQRDKERMPRNIRVCPPGSLNFTLENQTQLNQKDHKMNEFKLQSSVSEAAPESTFY